MTQALDAAADLDLLALLRRGEASALDTLATRHGPMIYRLAFGITRNQGDAEEVLQDVLLTLARRSASFEGRSAVGSWIYRIATNTALNKRRGKRLELETSLEDLLPTFEADGHRSGGRTCLLTGRKARRKSSSRESGGGCSSRRSTAFRTTTEWCSSCGMSKTSRTRRLPPSSRSQSRR